MPEPASATPPVDLLKALSCAGTSAYLWTPEDDQLLWLTDPPNGLNLQTLAGCATGRALRRLYCMGDSEGRDRWTAQGGGHRSFTGNHRLGCDAEAVWIEERLVLLDTAAPGQTQILGLLRDVSQQRHEMERLTYLARFDELTGHLSRAHLRTVLARRMAAAREGRRSICYGLIGLDNMSGVNSAFGYDIGDVVLAAIGAEIARRIGSRDVLGRAGSSKFGIVFDACLPSELSARLGAIQMAIRDTVIETGAGPVAVTVSAAGVVLPDHAATTHDAFAAAEDALAYGKDSGGDQIALYAPHETVIARRRQNFAMADDLLAALREGRLRLAYQPVVRADDPTQIAFHECLLRLIDRSGKLINAGAFMPVAEKLGLVRMLDKRVLTMAFETLRRHPRVRLSVNLSPQSLKDAGWQAQFEALAAANAPVLERLILEVTEATAIDDADSTARILNRIRELGCAVALDDFGAGYTSFQQFKTLELDIVKIDGSYVRGVNRSSDDQLFVRTLSELARNYDLMVVAEMVEDSKAGRLLRGLGVDCFQGFHFGKPDVAPDWLEEDLAANAERSLRRG